MNATYRKVRRRLSRVLGKAPVARHADPVATHVPILIGIASGMNVKRVLELGSGENSTPTFLDRAAFPELEELVTLENDEEWAERMAEPIARDDRATLRLVSSVSEAVNDMDLERFDVVLLDDSSTLAEREATIRSVATADRQATLTVVHDFEIFEYRYAARAFRHRVVFDAMTPQTAVCWQDSTVDGGFLKDLRWRITEHVEDIAPSDRSVWIAALRG